MLLQARRRALGAVLCGAALAALLVVVDPARAAAPRVGAVTSSGAVVAWQTPRPTPSLVQVGTTTSYGLWAGDPRPTRSHSVRLAGLHWAQTYHVRAGGVDVAFATLPLSARPRTSSVGRDGAIAVDGVPFVPVMQWLQCPSLFPSEAALGVDVFMGKGCTNSDADELANAAKVNALSILPFAAADASSSALLAWRLEDEPELHGTRPSELARLYAADRAADPRHLHFLTLQARFSKDLDTPGWMGGNRDYYHEYARVADVLGFDLYPINGFCRPDWIGRVGSEQRELVTGYAQGKPTYQWIEAVGSAGTACTGRPVSAPEVRAEVWLALTNGAKAIGWFTHSWVPSYTQFRVTDAVQAEMKRTDRQIRTLAPALLAPAAPLRVDATGGEVDALARRYGGALYVFAVNAGSTPVRARFQLAGARRVAVWEEGRTLRGDGSGFADSLAPLAVHVYVVPPAQ